MAPILASTSVILASIIDQRYGILWDILLLLGTPILWAVHLPAPQEQKKSFLPIAFLLGFFYTGLAESIAQLAFPSTTIITVHIPIFTKILLAHLVLLWAQMLRTSQEKGYDLLTCYAHWPVQPLWRIGSLISYYASSNGLFVLTCATFFTLLLEYTNFTPILLQMDIGLYAGLVAFILIITKVCCSIRKFTNSPSYLLLTLWCLIAFLFFYLSDKPGLGITFNNLQKELMKTLLFLPQPKILHVKFGLYLLLIPLFAAQLYKQQQINFPHSCYFFLGMLLAPFCLSKTFNLLIVTAFLGAMLLNILTAKTPLHAFDAPFLKTQRHGLKAHRWLVQLSYAPLGLLLTQTLTSTAHVFIIIQNFGLLILISCYYFSYIQLIKALVGKFKNWYSKSNHYLINIMSYEPRNT
jgi:hypothetical protein